MVLPDGRILEYFVYGSEREDALILINFPGLGTTGKLDVSLWSEYYRKANVKKISITTPGSGYSSVDPHRKLLNWHKDVDVVLKQEKVDKFIL